MKSYVGVDVGGTFTDVFFLAADGSDLVGAKSPTTRPDPTTGIIRALRRLSEAAELDLFKIGEITVGSTLALNAVLESRGAKTALVTTRGFRDVIEIGRESRADLYDLQQESPRPLIPRRLRFEVDERISAQGEVIRPLRVNDEAEQLLEAFDATETEAVAICLINSYVASDHEVALRDAILDRRPKLFVCASVDVMPQYREYERSLVTCINAYVGPTMEDYLRRLEEALSGVVPNAVVRITDSLGGALNIRAAGNRPVLTMMSGPASGVSGATSVSLRSEHPIAQSAVVAMDMGGTSCDVTVVQSGRPDITSQALVGQHRFSLQTIDVHSIGAGGGTVAWVDDGGLLRVGPRSTGSRPGPACYGHGGSEAAITDAHLVLRHLDTEHRLGGEIQLDMEAAVRAIKEHVAGPLGLSVEQAASGMLRVADASMQRAIESITVRRGLDPRSFGLVAFGGAAPLHAASIARNMQIGVVVVPRFAGMLSAVGAVWAPEQYKAARTCLQPTFELQRDELVAWVDELEAAARDLAGDAANGPLEREVTFDMRFRGQTFTLAVPVADPTDSGVPQQVHDAFVAKYGEVFGYVLPGADTEVEIVRLSLVLADRGLSVEPVGAGEVSADPSPWRAAFEGHELVDCDLWHLGRDVAPPDRIVGPAVVVGEGSTALVHPGQVGTVSGLGDLTIVDLSSADG